MKYSGKIGVAIPLCIILSLVLTIYTLFDNRKNLLLTVLLVALALFLFVWNLPTYLILEKNYIEVRLGFHKKKILCKDIKSLKKSRDPIQSYALSLDRIKIIYSSSKSRNDTIMVSLKQNNKFIQNITNEHSHIQYFGE